MIRKLLSVIVCLSVWASVQAEVRGTAFSAYPPIVQGWSTTPNMGNDSLDNTADKVAVVFPFPKDGNVSTITFLLGAVAGASGNAVLDVRVETVDNTTGNPSGSLWGTTTNGSVTVAFNDDNSWKTATLTSNAFVTTGSYGSVVFDPTSFTTVTSVQLQRLVDGVTPMAYGLTDLTGAGYTKITTCYSIVIGYSDGTYVPVQGIWPSGAITATNFNSGSSPAIRGMRFMLDWNARIIGAWMWMLGASTSADFDVKLYDSDGSTVLASVSIDANISNGITAASPTFFTFTSSVEAKANKVYYLSIEPTTANNVTVYAHDAASNAHLDGVPGGKEFYLATKSGSTWTETTDSRPFMGLVISGFDSEVGGSYGVSH